MTGAFFLKEGDQVETFESVKQWKDEQMQHYFHDTAALNYFHDQVMIKVLEVAKSSIDLQEPPCRYAWFITGSGGRLEQGVISDQDHGIVYEISNDENDRYFQALGKVLADGLHVVGYPYCQGKIMSSNPVWCKSQNDWERQLEHWMQDESWEFIRQLQIFFDARVLYGDQQLIHQLKKFFFHYVQLHPKLLNRFMLNVQHIKNGIGLLGQILVERYGIYEGCIDLKYAAFLPYVNAVRLLSIREGIFETSTLNRIEKLKQLDDYSAMLRHIEGNFIHLLRYRLSLSKANQYEDTHYLKVNQLSKDERKVLKQILKDGKQFHEQVLAYIKKGVEHGI